MTRRALTGSALLLIALAGVGFALATWKAASIRKSSAMAASQPEPMESIAVAVATERTHQPTTTSIGTVLALQSVTLRNEIAGTVRNVGLVPGQIVEQGALLVALDVSVETAELKAQEAQAALTEVSLRRTQQLGKTKVASDVELDKARAEHDIAHAQIARTQAIIDRKTIRAPFRARVGMADLHPGQYLNEGTQITTLQGIGDTVHVDFTVPQAVVATLREKDKVEVVSGASTLPASIVALDSRIDPATRNGWVRAKIDDAEKAPAPGASVRVRVPVGPPRTAVAVPVSALRKGPDGDHLFVITPGHDGKPRASVRPVQSGQVQGDEVLIHTGLKAGERVAASGSFKLRESALVAITEETAPPAAMSNTEQANLTR
jgi:membrane fusion protein (multidrug efflux system)